MKRKTRKLFLNRETIVRLDDERLANVHGGFTARCSEGPGCDGTAGCPSGWFSCDVTICGCESHFCATGQTCRCV